MVVSKHSIKISIITVVYNGGSIIDSTIRSIMQQTYPNKEYIVIDGLSTDNTNKILESYSHNIDHYSSEKDKGIYDAMNKGCRAANGEWIIFMNAGDRFSDPRSLEILAESISDDVDMIYGDADIIDKHGDISKQVQLNRHLDKTKSIIHQSMLIRRSFLADNNYDISYKVMADYENLLKLSCSAIEKIRYTPVTVCIYDKTGVSSRRLYTYGREYREIANRYMNFSQRIRFFFYYWPRLIYSYFRND